MFQVSPRFRNFTEFFSGIADEELREALLDEFWSDPSNLENFVLY